jgi:hypothetical protein
MFRVIPGGIMRRGLIGVALGVLVMVVSGGSAGAQTVECTVTGTPGSDTLIGR